jgi:hypothetical protein
MERAPIPKVHINGKINTTMEKKKNVKNQCLVGSMW